MGGIPTKLLIVYIPLFTATLPYTKIRNGRRWHQLLSHAESLRRVAPPSTFPPALRISFCLACMPRAFGAVHNRGLLDRPYTTSSSTYGSFTPLSSRSPFAPRPLIYEPPPSPVKHGVHTQLTSEDVGSFYSSFRPISRPRPASDCTIQMRNRAIKDGIASSEAVGGHTGVTPRHHLVGGFGRPQLSPSLRFAVPTSASVIGIHPSERLSAADPAAMHSEANFARRFPWHPQGGRTSDGAHALEFQDSWIKKSAQLRRLPPMAHPTPVPARHVQAMSDTADRVLIRPDVTLPLSSLHTQPMHAPSATRTTLPGRSFLGVGEASPS